MINFSPNDIDGFSSLCLLYGTSLVFAFIFELEVEAAFGS